MSAIQKFTPWFVIFAMSLTACAKKDAKTDPSSQQPFPYLGTSASYAILAKTEINNSGSSTVYGGVAIAGSNKLGLAGVKRTGGDVQANNSVAAKAHADSENAYNNLRNNAACDRDLSGQNLGGMTLPPGTYCFSGDTRLDGLLRLDFQGNPHARFIFKSGGDLSTGVDSGIIKFNPDKSDTCNIFWQVPGSVQISANSNLIGGFLSIGNISLGNKARLDGKLSSQQGAVSLDTNEIYNNFCPWWK